MHASTAPPSSWSSKRSPCSASTRLIIVKEGQLLFDDSPAAVLEHAEELLAEGINCPRSTSLANRLRKLGLYSGPACRNVAEAVRACEEVLA